MLDPAQALKKANDNNQIRFYDFDDTINPGVGAQTVTGSMIQIASNRYFVTGILANGASLTAATGFQGLTLLQADELILIHELLHFVGVVGADDAGQRIGFPNGDIVNGSAGVTAEVRKQCF